MNLMGSRQMVLERTMDGLNATGIPLIAKVGDHLEASGFTDDMGIHYFVPALSKFLGVTPQAATDLFLSAFIVAGLVLGSYGFFSLFKNKWARLISLGELFFLGALTFQRIGDVYVTLMFAVTAIVPNFLVFSHRVDIGVKKIIPWLVFSGILLGYCNIIRSHSGTGIVLFLVPWLLVNRKLQWRQKFICFMVLLVFFQVGKWHFSWLEKNRDYYLQQAVPDYKSVAVHHPLWHSVYIGLGYLNNPYGISYSDTVAAQKVASVDRAIGYCTPEYEEVLKRATFQIVEKDPLFILRTLWMKALKLFFYFLIFTNFGIVCFFYARPSWRETMPMGLACFFYSLPGLLVMPFPAYVLGMISMSVVFGIYVTGTAVEKYFGNGSQSGAE